MLGRALQIDAPDGARRGQTPRLRAGEETLRRAGQRLIRPVVIETERLHGGQQRHMLAPALRRNGHAERDLVRPVDERLHQIQPVGDIRAVEPHPLQRGAAQQRCPLRDAGRRVHPAVHGLRRQPYQLHLRHIRAGPLPQALDVAVQLVPQRLHPPDQRRQVERIVKVPPYVAEGQAQRLQDADGPYLHKGVDGVVAVARGAVLGVRTDQAELLVIEDGAARDAQRPTDFANRKQISVFFHKILPETQKGLASHVNVRCMILL